MPPGEKGNPYTVPISHDEIIEAKREPIAVSLTGGKTVPVEWFDEAKGNKILGVACGGGQQGPIFVTKGFGTTIMDYSEAQLASDKMVSEREDLSIKTVCADMTQEFPFENECFDIVFCPVSNAYIEDLGNMWRESYRVLNKEGLLMVGYVNPWIYMYDGDDVWDRPSVELLLKYPLPFHSKKLEAAGVIKINPGYGYEFSHTLEAQIGGQLKAGFVMVDFYESHNPRNRLTKFGKDYIANLCTKL